MNNTETKNFSQNVSSSYHLEDRGKCNKSIFTHTCNAPKLRFKGYNDKWKHYRLKEIVKIYDGTHQTPNYINDGIKFVSVENISNLEGTNKYISKDDYDKDFKIKPEINDVLMTRIGDIGTPAIIDTNENYAYYVSLALLKSNQEILFPKFFIQRILSESFQHELWKRTLHVAFPKKINKNEIGECNVFICSKSEQEKIASFLTLIDKKIEKQKELVELLKKYKRGLLFSIFSQKLRFKDNNGNDYPDWTEKTLGEVTDNISYGLNAASKKFDSKNKYIRITDIDETTGKYNNLDIVSPDCVLSDEYKLKINDLLFARTGASTGKTYLYNENDGKMYFAGFLIKFSIKEEYYSNFIFYITQTFKYKKWVSIMSTRSGQPGINAKEYSKYKFPCPVYNEQVKISNIISKIDIIIEKANILLDFYNDYKKGLLQKMFI